MRRLAVTLALLLSASCLLAADKYVSPSGSGSTCSLASPGSLATAVSGGCGAAPGDTIWARGGTYNGRYTINLQGSSSAPIILRAYPGEQPTIDGGDSGGLVIVYLSGSYYWLWGFEITSSNTDRTTDVRGSWPDGSEIPAGEGVTVISNTGDHPGVKVINCIIHDTRQGLSIWATAVNFEAYGNIVYYNGWWAPDRRHGHGCYGQSRDTDTDVLRNNFFFNNADHGCQIYGSDQATIDNFQFYETAFAYNYDRNLLIGGGVTAKNPKVINNTIYASKFSFGYYWGGFGTSNGVVTGNQVSATAELYPNSQTNLTMTGNTFVNTIGTPFSGNYPSNTYLNGATPSTPFRRVVKNTYDPTRCHVHIINYPNTNTATADLTPCGYANGAAFQVRNARNWFPGPWQTGVYSSSNPNFTFQMAGQTNAAPRGLTASEYPVDALRLGLFVVIATGGGGPTATPAPSTPVPTVPNPTVTPTPPASAFTVNLPTSSAVIVSPVTYSAGIIASVTQDLGSATFAFSVPSAGTYRVWHYVWADNSGDDSWYVSMDGGAEDVDDVAEGQWTPGAWKWTTAAARAGGAPASVNPRLFTLSAGAHTLKFRGREDGSKIGNVYVTNDPAFVPPVSTPTPVATSTPQPTFSPTGTPSATFTVTPSATHTPTRTPTPVPTGTPPIICLTATPTPTP